MARLKRVPVAKTALDLSPAQKAMRISAASVDQSRSELLKAHAFSARAESAVAPPADEADHHWQGVGAITPPYEPYVLLVMLEHSNSLRQCIDAYVTNIDAFGHRFEPVIDVTANDANDRIKSYLLSRDAEKSPDVVADPNVQLPAPSQERIDRAKAELIEKMRDELGRIQHFFEYACLDQSFVSLRRDTRQDIESLGNAYWEGIKDESGCLAGFEYVPSFTIRHMAADRHPTPVQVRVKKNDFDYTTVSTKKYFRRFVQVFESRVIWFKEYGDPRTVSRKDGTYFSSTEELKERDKNDEPASELIHFRVRTSKSSYGIPRWIGTILSVLGSRQAEEVNLTYFENKSVPPLALLVSGGKISQETVQRIQDFIDNDIKGKKNFHKILVLEAESPGTSAFDNGRMKIDLKPLTSAQHNDALFQNYDERNIDKVGMAFRLPRMLRGDIRDFNRATADAAIEFAEQQVFKPERDEFDFTMNRKILPALGIRFWKFKSNAVEGHNSSELATILEGLGAAGFITPAEGRDLAEKIFNRPFQKIDAPWVRQPIELTKAGIVPPDDLMAPGMTTPQAAATGAAPAGGQPATGVPGATGGPANANPAAPPGALPGVTLTGTDTSTVVTVNEARAGMGLGNLKDRGGQDDPDGWLTVAEFKAKRMAAGQTLGASEGQADAKEDGYPVASPPEGGFAKDDMGTSDLQSGGALVASPVQPNRRRRNEEKGGLMDFVQQLMMLRKAMSMLDEHEAEAAFAKRKDADKNA